MADDSEYVGPVAKLLAAGDVDGLVALLADDGPVGRHAMFALAEIGSEALPALREAIASDDPVVGGWAAVALADMGDAGADDRLIAFVRDIDYSKFPNRLFEVWEAAVVVLGDRKVRATVEPLIEALHCDDPDVRGTAAESLGAIGDARAVDPLIRLLLEEEVPTLGPAGWRITEALESLGGEKAKRAVAQWEAREEAWLMETS